MQEIIKVEDLCKTYDSGVVSVNALKHIDITIEQGEFVAIMGHSGSGKSTLMKNIAQHFIKKGEDVDLMWCGHYYLDGIDIADQTADELSDIRNKKIGFVFQAFNLIPRTSALKNVELPMIYAKMSAKERIPRAQELLEKVGLGGRMDHMPNELSGGQKQRVAIARALANRPPIILADEPTGNLDSASTTEIMELFTKLNEEGVTVIIVTHEDDVAAFAKRVLWFEDGALLYDKKVVKEQ